MRPAWFAGLLGILIICPRPAGSLRGSPPSGAGGMASSIPLSPRTEDLAMRSAELAMGGDYAGAFIAAAQGLREAPTHSVRPCALVRSGQMTLVFSPSVNWTPDCFASASCCASHVHAGESEQQTLLDIRTRDGAVLPISGKCKNNFELATATGNFWGSINANSSGAHARRPRTRHGRTCSV